MPEFFEARRQGSRSTRIEDAQDSLVAVIVFTLIAGRLAFRRRD